MKVSELEGALLDYWVARAEGYVWVKNASRRSGDSYRKRGEPERWPVGARFFVKPSKATSLHPKVPNWDGWLVAAESDPVGPAWDSDIFPYSTSWSAGGPIIEREGIETTPCACKTEKMWSAWLPFASTGEPWRVFGPTPLIAAMRAYVASKFGETVEEA